MSTQLVPVKPPYTYCTRSRLFILTRPQDTTWLCGHFCFRGLWEDEMFARQEVHGSSKFHIKVCVWRGNSVFCFASTALSTQRLSRSRCDLSGRGLTAATQSRSVKLLSMQSSTPSNASTIHKMTPRHSDQHVHNSMSTPGSFEQNAPSRAPICTGVVAAPQGAQHDTQKSPPPRKSTCPSCSSSATTSRIRRVTE